MASTSVCTNLFEDFSQEDLEIEETDLIDSDIVLESSAKNCAVCSYGIVKEDIRRRSQVILYSRAGTLKGISVEKRCNNYRCQTGYFYGYYCGEGNSKVCDEDILEKKYLLTSNRTGFAIDYLWDIVLQIQFSCASFESLGNMYIVQQHALL